LKRSKFLIFATDLLPIGGLPSSGTAIRTFGLAEGLRANGHQVVVSVPQTAIDGFDHSQKEKAGNNQGQRSSQTIDSLTRKLAFSASNQLELVAEIEPDIIICGHWPAVQFPKKPKQPLIIDLAGPHMLERHFQGSADQQSATLAKISAIATADGLITSGPAQNRYFESFIARTGIPAPARCQIAMPLAPAVSSKQKTHDKEHFPEFFFGGVFLPWQNPSHCLKQVAKFLSSTNQGRLTLIGGKHPHYNVDSGVYEELFESLQSNSRARTLPLLPYDQYLTHLEQADVALDLMSWNLERELAIPIRSTNYLNSGIPVIHNNFSDLSRLIEQHDAGWCIEPDNDAALRRVLEEIISEPEIVKLKSANARKLSAQHFDREVAVKPLIEMAESLTRETSFFDISNAQLDSANLSPHKNSPLSQSFLTRADGLKSVEVLLTTKQISPKNDTRLTLSASQPNHDYSSPLETDSYSEVGHTTVSSGDRLDDCWVEISVEGEIKAGSWLRLEIMSDSEEPETYPWIFHASPYPLKTLKQGEVPVKDSSLCIRTRHQR